MNKKKIIFAAVIVLLAAAFCISAFVVVNYLRESREQEELYNELAQIATATTPRTEPPQTTAATTAATEETEQTDPTEPTMIPGYEELYNQNSDMVGWLRIDNTRINYPVMQTPEDGQFYLYKDFNKNGSASGTLFAWEDADVNEPSDNITIFGHNMANGSMFAALGNYTNKATWESNPLIFFDTLTEYHTYKIFAVFKVDAVVGNFAYHQFVDAEDEAAFDEFVATCKELAFYDTGITPKYGDKLICLSTCEYTLKNGRLVVAAVRID